MSEATRIRRNSLFSFLSIAVRLISNFLIFMIIARKYGPSLFGQLAYSHTLSVLFIAFADFGFDALLITEIAFSKTNAISIFNKNLSFKLIFSVVALIVMWSIPFIFKLNPGINILIFIFSFYTLATTLTNFLSSLYKGFERFEYDLRVSFWVNLLTLLLVLFFTFLQLSIIIIAIVFVLCRFLGLIISFNIAKRKIPNFHIRVFEKGWSDVTQKVFIFGFQMVFAYTLFYADTILLPIWKSNYEIGIYQAAIKLIALPLVIPDIFINALMPNLSRLFRTNQDLWKQLGSVLNRVLNFIALLITMLLYIYAKDIIHLIYGRSAYNEAIFLIKIFAIILFIRFSVETYALFLTTSNNQLKRLYVVFIGTVIAVIFSIILIPKYGIKGAAYSALITNFISGILFIIFSPVSFRFLSYNKAILWPVVTVVVLTIIQIYVNFIPIFFMIPLSLAIYLFTIIKFGFSKQELKMIFDLKKLILNKF